MTEPEPQPTPRKSRAEQVLARLRRRRRSGASTAASWLSDFTSAHGGAQHVFLERVSAHRVRLVVVARDGTWGDAVVSGADVEALTSGSGFDFGDEWDRDSSQAVVTGRRDWKRMAGSF